jgi:Protein of unknown function DUF262
MISDDKPLYEQDLESEVSDPDEVPIRDRKVVTQPYDLAIENIVSQVKDSTIFLRPLSDRPKFQRQYVWNDVIASRLVESVLLNVPIPPCYLSQNADFELDVIDGQQRIYSLFRFVENQFKLKQLKVLPELNGLRFFELSSKLQRQLTTHTLRCVLVTNQSHSEIKFDVFERLNTNTVPLSSQELRNCVYRGPLNDLLGELAEGEIWLSVLGRKSPDKRLRDEELILRFFAYHLLGLGSYRTPMKNWLNDAAIAGRKVKTGGIDKFRSKWVASLDGSLELFGASEAFRRPGSRAINRALFDLVMATTSKVDPQTCAAKRTAFRSAYASLLDDTEFQDLIGRAVDHTSRTNRRFEIWRGRIERPVFGL